MAEQADEVFEVEDILRYRKNENGDEYFLVKWVGFPASEATWEPLAHMNEDCRELIAKARALFAWNRPKVTGGARQGAANEVAVNSGSSPPIEAKQGSVSSRLSRDLTSPRGDQAAQPPKKKGRSSATAPPAPALNGNHSAAAAAPNGAASAAAAAASSSSSSKAAFGGSSGSQGRSSSAPPLGLARTPGPPVLRGMRCTCNDPRIPSAETVRKHLLVCYSCENGLHRDCIRNTGASLPKDPKEPYHCPLCRIEKIDEFYPLVGEGLLGHVFSKGSGNVVLNFHAQPAHWKRQEWAVHLRAVSLQSCDLRGPAWPYKVLGKINGKANVSVEPPKHLHTRREQCYNITPLLRQGGNTMELKCSANPNKKEEDYFCYGIVLVKPGTIESLIARVTKSNSKFTAEDGKARMHNILAQTAANEAGDECQVAGNFGRTMKPLCPVSHCPIETAVVGRNCNHLQVFDLHPYVSVNQRMRALDKRWTCPVCASPIRPNDIIFDKFAQTVLDSVRGKEETVETIVFSQDCTWNVHYYDKDGVREHESASPPAQLISLDDSD